MRGILDQAWQVVHSWATARPVLFVMMNIVIGGILVTSAKLRGKPTDAEDDTGPRQASLLTRFMSRNLSRKFSDYDTDFQSERIAPAEIDYHETQYDDEVGEESGDEIKEENYSEKREEEKEIQEDVQQKSKYPPRNQKPSLSRRTRQSSGVPPGEGSSGETAGLSSSSGEIAGAASSSRRQDRLPPPPAPTGLRKTGSFLSSLVSFRRGLNSNISESTGLDRKTQGESSTGASTAEVDTEAEDFIRKFRGQLKLQRLESILRGGR